MEAKRWNERLRLVMTALNTTAIGLFGLSVIAPILAQLAARKAESAGGTVAAFDKLGLGKPFSLTEGVVWQAAAAALFLHALAHILVAFMERED